MKPTSPVRIHLNVPDEEQQQPRRSSFDFNSTTSILSPTTNRLTTNLSPPSSISLDRQRNACISSVSSSYALFLKQRDMDKNKKNVS
jgi:hypothetical protein